MFGLYLVAVGQGAKSGTTPLVQSMAMGHVSVHTGHPAVGLGAGAATDGKTGTNAPALCINPFDVTCWLQSAAQQVVNALQPVIDAILTQTPPADTYQNPTLITWFAAFLTVVDLALASLIVIGGYNVMVGRHLWGYSELAEFLPHLLLAFGAAHFGLFFLGLFIDLENALCGVATIRRAPPCSPASSRVSSRAISWARAC